MISSTSLSNLIEPLMAEAAREAALARSNAVEPVHLLIAALARTPARLVEELRNADVDLAVVKERIRVFARRSEGGSAPRVSTRALFLLAKASKWAERAGRSLSPSDVLVAILKYRDDSIIRLVEDERLDVVLRPLLLRDGGPPPSIPPPPSSRAPLKLHPETPLLDAVGRDLSALARRRSIPPVMARAIELKHLTRALAARPRVVPVLVGEAGVGKTAIAEAFAVRASHADAAPELRDLRVVAIHLRALPFGRGQGALEAVLEGIVAESQHDRDLVLFLDDVHLALAVPAFVLAMNRGAVRVFGATTPRDYFAAAHPESPILKRLRPIRVDEPGQEDAREILAVMRAAIEAEHRVVVTSQGLEAAVDLSVRYIVDRPLPAKAREVLRAAALYTANEGRREVGRADVARIVAAKTDLPVSLFSETRDQRVSPLEALLVERVVGQENAAAIVSKVVSAACDAPIDSRRPFAVFLLVGPSGAGKTEIARVLGQVLFDDTRHVRAFDMAEYEDEWAARRLVGAPFGEPGHERGGELTREVRRLRHAILVFENVARAHPSVFDLLLQIAGDGRLTDASGRLVDFRDTILVLTHPLTAADAAGAARSALASALKPELINRISRVIQLHPLGADHTRKVAEDAIARVRGRLARLQIGLTVDTLAESAILEAAARQGAGARGIVRAVERLVLDPIAVRVLRGALSAGDSARVEWASGAVRLTVRRAFDDAPESDHASGAVLSARSLDGTTGRQRAEGER